MQHSHAQLTWQQTDPPVDTQTSLLLTETTLALAGQQGGVFGQQDILSVQALRGHLFPQRGDLSLSRTPLQAMVQRLALRVSGAHTMGFNTISRRGREGEEFSWGGQHT